MNAVWLRKCTSVSCSLLDIPVGSLIRLLLLPFGSSCFCIKSQPATCNNQSIFELERGGVREESERAETRRRTDGVIVTIDIYRFSLFHDTSCHFLGRHFLPTCYGTYSACSRSFGAYRLSHKIKSATTRTATSNSTQQQILSLTQKTT